MQRQQRSGARIDPFDLELFTGSLTSISDEMFQTTMRSARSTVIYDVLDYSNAITDSGGNVVALSCGIPLFTGVFDLMVRAVVKRIRMEEGDVVMTNDPYLTGTHLNDMGFVMPVFDDGLVAFCVCKGHLNDIGGNSVGSWSPDNREVYQEGIQVPPVKVVRGGEVDSDIIGMVVENSRVPDVVEGDIMAMIASLRKGASRLSGLLRSKGFEFGPMSSEVMRRSEEMARQRIATFPQGTYTSREVLDNGMEFGCTVRIRPGGEPRVEVEFTGVPPQVMESINTTLPGAVSAARSVYVAVVDPHADYNQGLVRPLDIRVPRSTILSAEKPAPVGVYWETTTYAADAVWKALAPVFPDRLSMGHFLSVAADIVAGRDVNGKGFVLVEPNPGGWGATESGDGESALVSLADGETYCSSVEVIERNYPIRVEEFSLNVKDGSGRGKYRGGFGIRKVYRVLVPAFFTAAMNRSLHPPWGNPGEGTPNYVVIGGKKLANVSAYPLGKGETVEIVTGGGGGYGNEEERPEELKERDALYGYR